MLQTETPTSTTSPHPNDYGDMDGERVLLLIREKIERSGINDNSFYRTFRASPLPRDVLKHVFQQYYYYIRTFPQILAGTSHRVDSELVRMKLARTVVSELGDETGDPHFLMFERVLRAVGITLDDWRTTSYEPEAADLVEGLRRLFLDMSSEHAIGAHYVIEEFGFPMIVNLYEGFRQYPGWKHDDFAYFYLHMIVESDHVDWIRAAALDVARSADAARRLLEGATEVLALLTRFWSGLDRLAHRA